MEIDGCPPSRTATRSKINRSSVRSRRPLILNGATGTVTPVRAENKEAFGPSAVTLRFVPTRSGAAPIRPSIFAAASPRVARNSLNSYPASSTDREVVSVIGSAGRSGSLTRVVASRPARPRSGAVNSTWTSVPISPLSGYKTPLMVARLSSTVTTTSPRSKAPLMMWRFPSTENGAAGKSDRSKYSPSDDICGPRTET